MKTKQEEARPYTVIAYVVDPCGQRRIEAVKRVESAEKAKRVALSIHSLVHERAER